MKYIHIPEIGNISIRKHKRSRSLRATMQPDGSFKVTIPASVSYKEAIKFLHDEKAKIIQLRQKHKNYKDGYNTYLPNQQYQTKFHKFDIECFDKPDFHLKNIDDTTYKILVPNNLEIESEQTQFYLRKIVREIYRFEAKHYLVQKTLFLAKQHDLKLNKVTIKNLKSRWGSCSSLKNINLNLNLMRLDDDLIDYVILHELTHLKVQNHGTDFWRFLSTLIKNPKSYDKKLQQYSLRHFAT